MTTSTAPLALVTGASRGIGRAIARRLAKDGMRVLINYARSAEHAESLKKEIEAAGGFAETIQFDVAKSDQVDAALEQIQEKLGPITVLINNAGLNRDQLLLRLKNEELDEILDVDLKGAIYCTRAVTRSMMRAKTGSIVFVSSVIGEMGNAGQSAYAAAKAGLFGFSKSVAQELASRNIRANCISPGFIETEMTQALTDVQKEAILGSVPLKRWGSSDEVAALVSFLASDESRYITGQVIGINGGLYM